MSDLAKLARPFPDRYVKKPPKGKYGSYVKHSTIAEALLATVGAYDLVVKEIVRGDVAGFSRTNEKTGEVKSYPDLHGVVVAVVAALTLDIDGRSVTVEEAGDCDDPHNWTHDGQRLKDAVSDAVKRCAMRFGLGLHLWSQDDYFLFDSLTRRHGAQGEPETGRAPHETPARTEEGGDPPSGDGPAPPSSAPDPVLPVKRGQFRKICSDKGLDPDQQAAEAGFVSLEKCDLATVEKLIEATK